VCYRVHPYSLALHIYIASLLHSYSINSVLHLLSPTIRDISNSPQLSSPMIQSAADAICPKAKKQVMKSFMKST
jgi:hypothetical protein